MGQWSAAIASKWMELRGETSAFRTGNRHYKQAPELIPLDLETHFAQKTRALEPFRAGKRQSGPEISRHSKHQPRNSFAPLDHQSHFARKTRTLEPFRAGNRHSGPEINRRFKHQPRGLFAPLDLQSHFAGKTRALEPFRAGNRYALRAGNLHSGSEICIQPRSFFASLDLQHHFAQKARAREPFRAVNLHSGPSALQNTGLPTVL